MKTNSYMLIFVYAISLLLIAGISIITNIKNNQDIKISLLLTLLAIIPTIYSLIPLIKDSIAIVNRNKNKLTSAMFTDREKDLKHLLTILSSQDHRIEIKGNGEKCGKTWLAMRLCDYINHPKKDWIHFFRNKFPYKRAFYVDLKKDESETLESFFNSNIIMRKDVIIFDHVEDIVKLISKQDQYHFQMVYVMKRPTEINISSHYISRFNTNDIEKLHEKIRNTYPRIDQLSKREFDKLYDLTDGNIGRISRILEEQKSIQWLKDISHGSKTEYDVDLDKIQIELFIGHYKMAEEMLEKFKQKYSDSMKDFMDIEYKYQLMRSDCKHLLNKYNDALNILSIVELPLYNDYNKNYEIELHKAHYCKHLWNCNEALNILRRIKTVSYSAIVDSLGILAAKYFINDLHVDFSSKNVIEVYKEYYICAENSNLAHTQADLYKLKRNKAIYEFYVGNYADSKELISYINNIIDIYRSENNRLLANAYFIQGEIYRLYKEYNNAIISYKNCLGVTCDNNITIQVNLMVYYLKNVRKLNVNFDVIDNETVIKLCEYNNYADKICRRIKCIENDDPNANEIMNCFDSRIMPIL